MAESQGCWSCRIRRKKVAAALKEEVRQGAAHRRQNAHIQRLQERSSSIAVHNDEDPADRNQEDDYKSINRGSHGHYDNGGHKRTDGSTDSSELPITTEGSELDLGFIMHYMDHVFPLFFPFYRASMLDDGRGWLLAQILKNPTLLSTVSCMTLFVFSIQVPDTFANKAPPCSAILWDKVTLQLEEAFSTIKGDIARLFPPASKSAAYAPNSVLSPANMLPLSSSIADLRQMCGLLTSIVQLICFEIGIGNSENCVTHLDAALELFDIIVKISLKDTVNGNNEQQQQQQWPGLSLVFRAIAGPPWTLGTYSGPIPRNADQVAFRFFSSILVVYDTMMSTALLRAPSNPEFRMDLLDAEAIIGCQSWVLAVIGEIATLAAWKKEPQAQADMAELDSRATHLRSTLETGLAELHAHPPRSTSSTSAAKTAATPDGISSLSATGMTPDTLAQQSWSTTTRSHIVTMTTRIWAHAAHIYLSVVVSGWQSRAEALNKHIQEILGVLEELRAIDDHRHRVTERAYMEKL
ncbi:hypothetical protein FANTH_7855 [Fusarium anthophilum]|uniref:Regulatory protein n=1 Tax=Fusarium anthophilum TaxID=48485 RepID=A0A8H5E1X2_9HYPO|nr:hypothetical protein FANTH_7855 [Fusarium anthophilum]